MADQFDLPPIPLVICTKKEYAEKFCASMVDTKYGYFSVDGIHYRNLYFIEVEVIE